MNVEVLTLTPGGQPIAQSLGFDVASVIVDNYTSSYVSLPDAGKTLPPWVYGAIVNLPIGLRTARAKLIPTVPAIGGPPVPTSQCTLTWTDAPLPQSAGHLLQQSQFATRIKLFPDGVATPSSPLTPSFTVPANTFVTKRFTLPAGAVAVRVLANISAAFTPFTYALSVIGHQTVEQYFGSPISPGSAFQVPSPTLPFTVPIEFDWDSQLDIGVLADPTNAVNIFVSALFAPEAPGQAGSAQSVVVPSPSPWQAPGTAPNTFSINLGALGITHIIVAVAGQTIRLFALNYAISAGGAFAGNFQDTAGVPVAIDTFQNNGPRSRPYFGSPLSVGVGLDWNTTSAGASFLIGEAVYSQQ